MQPRPRVVAILGPTASGKSDVALALADRLGRAELVSADAMQCYRGLPILTNQPTAADVERAPHHLVGIWGLDHEGDVAQYAAAAHGAIDAVLARGATPIVVGGTGLYLRAALARLELPPEPPAGLREGLEAAYDADGPAAAHARLAALDPAAAARVHPNDRRRVVRALGSPRSARRSRPPGPIVSGRTTSATRRCSSASTCHVPSSMRASRRGRGACSLAAWSTRCARCSPPASRSPTRR